MITHPPFRITNIALACHMGLPTSPATISFRPIQNHLPVRCLRDVLQGEPLYLRTHILFLGEIKRLLAYN